MEVGGGEENRVETFRKTQEAQGYRHGRDRKGCGKVVTAGGVEVRGSPGSWTPKLPTPRFPPPIRTGVGVPLVLGRRDSPAFEPPGKAAGAEARPPNLTGSPPPSPGDLGRTRQTEPWP